ncbi:MAG TPA: hypothetical protein VFX37_01280 [Pseudolabrys sp.]|nr:hypothetical protein [Pseudolabrys sp.]
MTRRLRVAVKLAAVDEHERSAMTYIPSIDGQVSGSIEIERPNAKTKIARLQLLKHRYGLLCKTIGQVTLACGIVALFVYEQPARQVALDGTIRMDRVAEDLEGAKVIPPNSVQQISRLLREPLYDCTQVSCGAVLKNHNRVAREKLVAILARASPSLIVSVRQTPFGSTRGD